MKEASAAAVPERTFERLTLNQRLQHAVLMVSFTTLVVTGMPVRYAESGWAAWLTALMGGAEGRALLHRVAAVVLMLLAVYHVGYLVGTRRGRYELRQLIPWFPDAWDAIHHLLYYLGRRPHPPRFGRFSYIEKFEYLAVVWGTFCMGVTGLVLWFEVEAMRYLPKWAVDVCRVIHSYEALLAALAIAVWHLYCVHFRPDVFPMSRIWLDGRISEAEMKLHHPREYEEILRREAAATAAEEPDLGAVPQPAGKETGS
ncbi:MAG: hypothetical protein GX774_02025 [Armatimonadetes bacterium]|jgi:formate dehydrogenase subunit gamma|nr:hypothetical protein [Armatimonadota bacterium]